MDTVRRIAGRIIWIPIWFVVTIVYFLVKVSIEIYCIGKGIINVILGLLLLETLIWYREWSRFAILAIADGILILILWTGVFAEVMLEAVKNNIEERIIR